MKKMIIILLAMATLMIGCGKNEQINNETTEQTINNNINVTTTMMNDCFNREQFKGNERIEQMFVTDVEYTNDDTYNVVTLVDTSDNEWIVEGLDLYEYEEVLVLLVDNNTEDITDDVIVHCWVGLE